MSLRIALTHVYAWPEVRRGTERYLHELAAALRDAGHQVAITTTAVAAATGDERGVPVRYLRRRHVLRRRFGPLSDEVAFGAQTLARVSPGRIDVWHAMGTADAAAAALASTVRPGLRSVYTDHGFPYRPSRERRPDRRLHGLVVRRIDRYVCVSTAAAETLESGYSRTAEVRSGGVDVARFTPGGERHATPVVLFAGDADETRKNLPLLARAVGALRGRGTPAQLWVAGPGDQQRAVASALPADAVRLLGEVAPDDLVAVYRAAWVTALPARAEAFGLVLVESLACGTPIVALDEGGPRDIVRPGIGLLTADGEAPLADALAEAIDLASVPGTAADCRDAAMDWDWRTAVVPDMERIYGA